MYTVCVYICICAYTRCNIQLIYYLGHIVFSLYTTAMVMSCASSLDSKKLEYGPQTIDVGFPSPCWRTVIFELNLASTAKDSG